MRVSIDQIIFGMKIIHIIAGLNDGGAEAVLYRLVTYDAQDTHHVVSLMGEGKYGPLLRKAGVHVMVLNMPRGRLTWRGLRRLWCALREQRPQVIQTWMYHADLLGGVIGWLQRIPVVWGIHNTVLVPGQSTRSTVWVARMCALLSRWAPRHIVACAQAAADVHTALGYDAKRMVVIPNGYEMSRFAPDAAARQRMRQAWGVADDVPLIGMVARYDPYKDHENLIDSLAWLVMRGIEFKAVFVGTNVDDNNAQLVSQLLAKGLRDRVVLLGPTSDVPAVMNAVDVHVLSSSAEAFPNVLAEAMACGTPCVTTDVGDAALIVGDTGWVVPPSNPNALAQAIATGLHERINLPAEWTNRQSAVRQRIQAKFSIEQMVSAYQQVWASKN